jgi:hypothetical protein
VERRLTPPHERRRHARVPPEDTPWDRSALLRPGQEVVLVNLSREGALIASRNRMNPGARTELQLLGTRRRSVRGRIERCRVSALDPVCYEGVLVFDEGLEWREALTG